MIKIDNLSFAYDEESIFANFSDTFQKGERICLRGASGKGKTTLLRLIAGLEKPISGTVEYDKSLKLALCAQKDDLFPWYSALKNISIVSDEETAKKYMELFGLSGSEKKLPSALSGGMKKRVSLARCCAYRPDIMLIDEGFTGLESELKKKVMRTIAQEFKNSVIVFATHDDDEETYFATRTVNIEQRR